MERGKETRRFLRRHHAAGPHTVLVGTVALAGAVLLWYESYGSMGSLSSRHPAQQASPSLKDRIASAAQKHLGEKPGTQSQAEGLHADAQEHMASVGPHQQRHEPLEMRGDETEVGREALEGTHGRDVTGAEVAAQRECRMADIPSWQKFVPPAFSIPGHLSGRQVQQAVQLASAEERMKRMSVFGEEGEAEEVVQEGSKGASIPSGMDYPGVIQLTGRAENYTIGGTGLLRAEPYLREGSGFYIRNSWQVQNAIDSFYVRLVGPSIVVASCRIVQTRESPRDIRMSVVEYICTYNLREPGVYTLQVWAEYRDLPASVVGDANPKGQDPDPMVANSNTFERAELLLYTGLVDGRYAEGSAMTMGAFARNLDSGGSGLLPSTSLGSGGSPADCATGLRRGRWVARSKTGCTVGSPYLLLREAWEWRPYGCRLREFCGAEGRECLSRFKTLVVAGDSIARELFDEVGSVMLQRDVSWREIFPHKHASGSRQVGGTLIKMLWIPDPLTTITQQLRGPLQLREQYTGADVLVVSAGYWYIYRTSLEEYLEGLKNLTAAATEALGSRTTVVLVSVPSGWMNFGYRIRPRIEAWNEAAARVASAAGWIVVDAFHLSDARPEKTDGTHIGNDTDRTNMQGGPTLSKSVANMLLGALCGSNGNGAAPIGPMEKPMAATLPIEWPNWPSSRRYVSRDALMRAKGRSTAPQMETTERVASDPKSGKARERVSSLPKPRIIMLGGQDHAAGLGGGKHSRKGRPAHHGN